MQVRPSKAEGEIARQVAALEADARQYELPATFMKWAKMKRDAGKLEKELLKLQEQRRLDSAAAWRQHVSRAASMRLPVMLALLFFVYESQLPKAPLLEFSSAWLWPAGWMLASPNYSAGQLSVVGWATLCQILCARLFKAVSA